MKTHQETLQENETLKRQLSEAQETIELVKSQLTRALEAIVADETMPLFGKDGEVFATAHTRKAPLDELIDNAPENP